MSNNNIKVRLLSGSYSYRKAGVFGQIMKNPGDVFEVPVSVFKAHKDIMILADGKPEKAKKPAGKYDLPYKELRSLAVERGVKASGKSAAIKARLEKQDKEVPPAPKSGFPLDLKDNKWELSNGSVFSGSKDEATEAEEAL